MNFEPLCEIESEKTFLGSILQKGTYSGSDIVIVPEDFYNGLHRRIFQSILELLDVNIQIDPVTLSNHLREKSRYNNEEQENQYIFSLYTDSVVIQPIQYYASRIKKFSDRRNYLQKLNEGVESIRTNPEDNENIFTHIESELAKISRAVPGKGLKQIKENKNELIDYVSLMFETKGQTVGLKTKFHELDEVTTGLKPHELIIVAARPGMGKTTFALNIAGNVAMENKAVAIFSLEMSTLELLIKLVCSKARINSSLLKTGAIHKADQEKLLQSIVDITSAPIFIDDSGALTIWEFKSRLRQLMITEQVALVVVDYLQLMSDPTVREGRQQEVASISRNLKQMAKEANCPILALSQMSRAIETRSKDQRPQLSDLRESGAIEQDADIVSFIYREDKVKEDIDESKKNIAEIIIAKNRSGQTRSFNLLFSPEYSRFDNL